MGWLDRLAGNSNGVIVRKDLDAVLESIGMTLEDLCTSAASVCEDKQKEGAGLMEAGTAEKSEALKVYNTAKAQADAKIGEGRIIMAGATATENALRRLLPHSVGRTKAAA